MIDDRVEPGFTPGGVVREQEPPSRNRTAPIAAALVAVALAVGGWYLWTRHASPAGSQASGPAPAASVSQPAPEAASDPQPPTLVPAPAEAVLKAEDIQSALTRLLGRDDVLKFLETTDFPRRLVATLDSLGREHAPVLAWPVQPTPGRFAVEGSDGSATMAVANELRYAPFVAFVGSVDAAQAVDLYRRMYPVLEQAYRDLGLVKPPLNARVFEIIDLLLATPEPTQPPKLMLTEVKGPIEAPRPWTRYEYEDARFQRLAAGQKMLLRVGPANRKVLKAKLQQLRQELLRVSTQATHP